MIKKNNRNNIGVKGVFALAESFKSLNSLSALTLELCKYF